MSEWFLDWRDVSTKKDVLRVQGFACAEPWPTTPRGRKLPAHPRPWEWEAQRHIRSLTQVFRDGDLVMVGVDLTRDPQVDAAVLHQRYTLREQAIIAEVAVGGVALSHRSPDPPFLGDEVMDVALEAAREEMAAQDCTTGLLVGHIHVENNASMRMAARNGWEPRESAAQGGYIRWARPID